MFQAEAEAEVLKALVRADPSRFIEEVNPEVVKVMRPHVRQIVVDCYRHIGQRSQHHIQRERVVDALVCFLSDSTYTIRRMAGRSLAEVDGAKLQMEAAHLFHSREVLAQCHGLEALAWVSDDEMLNEMLALGKADREDLVRRHADEANEHRRKNGIISQYVDAVLACPDDNLLSVCHYAQALSKIGDDEAMRRIRRATGRNEERPNKRAFLTHVLGEIKKGWAKQLRKDATISAPLFGSDEVKTAPIVKQLFLRLY